MVRAGCASARVSLTGFVQRIILGGALVHCSGEHREPQKIGPVACRLARPARDRSTRPLAPSPGHPLSRTVPNLGGTQGARGGGGWGGRGGSIPALCPLPDGRFLSLTPSTSRTAPPTRHVGSTLCHTQKSASVLRTDLSSPPLLSPSPSPFSPPSFPPLLSSFGLLLSRRNIPRRR